VPGLAYLGEPGAWFDHTSNYKEIIWDITSQVSRHQEMKLGTDWRWYDLSRLEMQHIYDNISIPVIDANGDVVGEEIPPDKRNKENCLWWNEYEMKPWESAAYLQDKIEHPGFVANVGLRWDYFKPNTWKYRDPFSPFKRIQDLGFQFRLLRALYCGDLTATSSRRQYWQDCQPHGEQRHTN
jgi:hypothetical protein